MKSLLSVRRHVLIADFDFFSNIGGGQTYYQKVVSRNPNITFFHLSRGADLELKAQGRLPRNAHPVPLAPLEKATALCSANQPSWIGNYLEQLAAQIAVSVAGRRFDAIDVPSFSPIITLLATTFEKTGVVGDRTVLSLLGWMSVGVANGYDATDLAEVIDNLRALERASAAAADTRVVVARRHQMEVRESHGMDSHLLDLCDFIDRPVPPTSPPPLPVRPDIVYFGRLDRNKGPDLFVDLVARLPRDSYRRCRIAGPDGPMTSGETWLGQLRRQAEARGLDFDYEGTPATEDVAGNLFGGHAVIVIPSRSDILPYVAFEAIAAGSPLMLSTSTGAYAFLRDTHPDLPIMPLDTDDVPAAAEILERFLAAYPRSAEEFRRALRALDWPDHRPGFMERHYLPDGRGPTATLRRWLRRVTSGRAA